MRFLLSSLCFFGLLQSVFGLTSDYVTADSAAAEFEYRNAFESFKEQFGVSYESQELENYRFSVFAKNLDRIAELNAAEEEGGAVFGITKFADMDPAEFKQTYLNYRPPMGEDGLSRLSRPVHKPGFVADPEANVDWRNTPGVVTAVKDQGNCGSCWAFSAVEEVESMWYLKHGVSNSLSPQQVVSCDTVDGGCNGGDTVTAYTYIQSKGLMTEKSFPYTSGNSGADGTCKYNSSAVVARISGFTYATPACFDSCAKQDETTLLNNLASTGPVSVCVYADPWQFYVSGVLSSSCPYSYSTLDHCVQLVGYGSSTSNYWIIRNSWGTSWGNAGYIYVKSGSNLCGVADEATFVTSA